MLGLTALSEPVSCGGGAVTPGAASARWGGIISPLCRVVCALLGSPPWGPPNLLPPGLHPQSLGENMRPFHNLEAEAARLRTRLTPVPQLAAREGLGAPGSGRQERLRKRGGERARIRSTSRAHVGLEARRDGASGASGGGTAPRG